jgi:predicted dehydrogenase
VHLDYLEKEPRRIIRIVGSDGTLECDLIGKHLVMRKKQGEDWVRDPKLFDIQTTYIDEVTHFIDCIAKDRMPAITLDDGIQALRLLQDGAA